MFKYALYETKTAFMLTTIENYNCYIMNVNKLTKFPKKNGFINFQMVIDYLKAYNNNMNIDKDIYIDNDYKKAVKKWKN